MKKTTKKPFEFCIDIKMQDDELNQGSDRESRLRNKER
jgi:hypothetical protein